MFSSGRGLFRDTNHLEPLPLIYHTWLVFLLFFSFLVTVRYWACPGTQAGRDFSSFETRFSAALVPLFRLVPSFLIVTRSAAKPVMFPSPARHKMCVPLVWFFDGMTFIPPPSGFLSHVPRLPPRFLFSALHYSLARATPRHCL